MVFSHLIPISSNFTKNSFINSYIDIINEKIPENITEKYIKLNCIYLDIINNIDTDIEECIKNLIKYNIVKIRKNTWELKYKLLCNLKWLRSRTKYNDDFLLNLLAYLSNLNAKLIKLHDFNGDMTISNHKENPRCDYSMKNYFEISYKKYLYLTHLGQSSGREFNIDPFSKLWIKNIKKYIDMK